MALPRGMNKYWSTADSHEFELLSVYTPVRRTGRMGTLQGHFERQAVHVPFGSVSLQIQAPTRLSPSREAVATKILSYLPQYSLIRSNSPCAKATVYLHGT